MSNIEQIKQSAEYQELMQALQAYDQAKARAASERVMTRASDSGSNEGTIGGATGELPKFPSSSLPQHSDNSALTARQDEIVEAQNVNWFAYDKLDGAVVHGNMEAQDLLDNTKWMLKGTDEERAQHAHEDDFGVDDAHPGENAIDIYEAVPQYVAKNFLAFIEAPNIISALLRMLALIFENIFNGDFSQLKFEIIDPVLIGLPARKALNEEELNFFPDDDQRYPKPTYYHDYRDDDLMGWLQVAPMAPLYKHLSLYTEHLTNFPVTNEMFKQVSHFRQDDLEQAMLDKRVFIANYNNFHPQTTAEKPNQAYGATLNAALALFAIPKNGGSLKIIAIQPTQNNQPSNFLWWLNRTFGVNDNNNPWSRILTPADDYWTWQMAKNTVTTMSSMSGVVDHLSTHLYLGPIPIAFYRNIPSHHPLAALLDTHLMSLVGNNFTGIFKDVGTNFSSVDFGDGYHGLLTGAISNLSGFSSESFVNATVARAQEYHFIEDSTPLDRSQDDDYAKIQDYALHDDNQILPIIKRWVGNYLSLYYSNDTDVINDYELQGFLSETTNLGQVNGFPDNATSIDELVDITSRIIFWMSTNHALDRFPSFSTIGSLGYYSSRVPGPGEVHNKNDWLNICPTINAGLALFVFSRIFVDLPTDWHRSLGKYPQGQFMQDQRIYSHLTKFQDELKALDDEIKTKNEARRWGFDLRMPSTITVSPWN